MLSVERGLLELSVDSVSQVESAEGVGERCVVPATSWEYIAEDGEEDNDVGGGGGDCDCLISRG